LQRSRTRARSWFIHVFVFNAFELTAQLAYDCSDALWRHRPQRIRFAPLW
jgi:hypothetical protein